MKSLLALLISVIMLSGCVSTSSAMKKLEYGMSKQKALRLTGGADSYRREGAFEIYTFTARPTDYQIIFTGDRVAQWGPVSFRP